MNKLPIKVILHKWLIDHKKTVYIGKTCFLILGENQVNTIYLFQPLTGKMTMNKIFVIIGLILNF